MEGLYYGVLDEFNILGYGSVKINHSVLQILALDLLPKTKDEIQGKNFIDERKSHDDNVHLRWIQTFVDLFRIVQRTMCGKLKLRPEKLFNYKKRRINISKDFEIQFNLEM